MIKRGFTLAEMTITLGLIGVLAVILLPVLKNSQPNEEMLKFKKAYYITERIVSELVNDDELYPEPDAVGAADYLGNTEAVTFHGQEFSGHDKFCKLFAEKVNTASAENASCVATALFESGGSFATSDGIVWILPVTSFDEENTPYEIQIDTNGTKAPNCSFAEACQNPDRFTIKVFQDGRVMVDGEKEIEYLNRTRITKGN